MGQSFPLLLVRAAGILCAGLLLFSMFSGAHAQRYDDYGLTPVGAATDFTPATAMMPRTAAATANNGYNAAPVNGGYNAPNGTSLPSNSGYAPASDPLAVPVAANGQYASPLGSSSPVASAPPQPLYQPAPAQSAPMQAAPVQSGPYGYKPDAAPTPAPVYPPQRPVQANAPADYGYKPMPAAVMQGGYQAAPAARMNPDYVLGAGDKLRLTVYGETDLSGEYTVDGSGYIRLPLIGQVRAAGGTAPQLENMIAGGLSQGYLKQPRVSVEVSTYRPFYIIGAVGRPGQYPYVNNMTALNAIALAGGFTTASVESAIYVRREGSNREVRMPTDRSTLIYPGDVVRVDSTLFADAMQLLNPLATPLSIAAAAAVP